MAEAQSDVAVQPTWILACAAAAPVSARLIAKVARIFLTAFSPFTFLLFIDIFDHNFIGKQGHPETCNIQTGGREKIEIVHTAIRLVRSRSRRWPERKRQPAFASMRH
jgi:hypothetical protein